MAFQLPCWATAMMLLLPSPLLLAATSGNSLATLALVAQPPVAVPAPVHCGDLAGGAKSNSVPPMMSQPPQWLRCVNVCSLMASGSQGEQECFQALWSAHPLCAFKAVILLHLSWGHSLLLNHQQTQNFQSHLTASPFLGQPPM